MQTETLPAPALTYNPQEPYRHSILLDRAIWRLPLTDEQKRSLSDLIHLSEREAFSRGLNPNRPLAY